MSNKKFQPKELERRRYKKRKYKRWTKSEIDLAKKLLEDNSCMTYMDAAKRLDRSWNSIKNKFVELGIKIGSEGHRAGGRPRNI